MKQRRNNSTGASALKIVLSVASISAALLASTFKAAPAARGLSAPMALAAKGDKNQTIAVPASGTWSATGSLNFARYSHTATLLPTGKVLVAGGFLGSTPTSIAELYDPASGSWGTTFSLRTPRTGHTATLLPNSKVLVAGGGTTSAELYDPASGNFSATGSLNTARGEHTATLLPNGKVLVAGGVIGSTVTTSAELYDPASGSWSATGSLNTARFLHTATLLPNGKVLVAGGDSSISFNTSITSAELYDPASGSWSAAGSLNTARFGHTATSLPNSKVLVAGGSNGGTVTTSAELYDPASGSWSATGSLNTAHYQPTATLLPNDKVLVAGGFNGSNATTSAELYDPASGTWTATGSLNIARYFHTATLLPTGKVLVAAGSGDSGGLTSAELYDAPSPVISWNNPAGGPFQMATNWDPHRIPAGNDDAAFNLPGTYTVTFDANAQHNSLVGNGAGVNVTLDLAGLDLAGHTYVLNQLQAGGLPGDNVSLAFTGPLPAQAGVAGLKILAGGKVNLSDPNSSGISVGGSTGIALAQLVVRDSLQINAGGQLYTKAGIVDTSVGTTVEIDGRGSKWLNDGESLVAALVIGSTGMGTVAISDGGSLEDSEGVLIGGDRALTPGEPRSIGTITVTGIGTDNQPSKLVAPSLIVGGHGEGTLTLTTGGSAEARDIIVGDVQGSEGHVTLSGVGSRLALLEDEARISVGHDGTATLDVLDGAVIEFQGVAGSGTGLVIANFGTGSGTVTVRRDQDGQPSRIQGGDGLRLGGTQGGRAALNIVNHAEAVFGVASIGRNVAVPPGGVAAIVEVAGGSLQFTFDTGEGAEQDLMEEKALFIGENGTLNVTGGGQLLSKTADIGGPALGVGSVTISGVGQNSTPSTWTTGTLFVETDSSGILHVTNGGQIIANDFIITRSSSVSILDGGNVISTTGKVGVSFIGVEPENVGVFVSGPTSQWTSQTIVIGESSGIGAGFLQVESGGTVTTNTLTIERTGHVSGNGTLTAANRIINGGTISPGLSPGLLTLNGDFEQASGGVLKMEVAGLSAGQFDVLHVTGNTTLDGTMEVTFLNGYLPRMGDVLNFLQIDGMLSGNFAQITFPQLAPGFQFQTEFVNGTYEVMALNDAILAPTPTPTPIAIPTPTPTPIETPMPTETPAPTSTPIPTPTLGDYPDTPVPLSGDTMVTPDATPANTTNITVSTSTNYKGTLAANPMTGVVTVTDAHPTGTYMVTAAAFGPGGTTTRTFTLTVTSTPCGADFTAGFSNAADANVGAFPISVAIGDFNGDGKEDLAVANDSNTVSIRLGDGLGGFSGATEVSVGSVPASVAIGDFNGDGKQDLAVANGVSGLGRVSIRLGDGLGGFSGSTEVSVGSTPDSVAIGDFNGDGKQDLAVANYGSESVSIRLGDGMGGFSGSTNVSVDSGPISVAIGDFNGDGKQDLAVANQGSNTVSIRLGDGLGSFSGSTEVSVGGGPQSVAIGDFNGDGKQDLAVANTVSTVSIRLGDGSGGFSGSTEVSVSSEAISVAIGDFNRDGKQDLAVANDNSDTISIRLGDGLGGFSGATEVGVGSVPASVAIGDFNGDGKQDLAVANYNSNTVSIRLGQCIPVPTPTPTPVPGSLSISGTVVYCSNPSLNPVPGVTMTLSGSASYSTASDGLGNYSFTSLAPGGSYIVTPAKAALPPRTAGIDTMDAMAAQRHYLSIELIPVGCQRDAADVDDNTVINTFDVMAIQRFFIGRTFGIANVGKYKFTPVNRSYPGLAGNQTDQNYDALVFGDVASSFVHRPGGPSQTTGNDLGFSTVATVALPEIALDQFKNNLIAAVKTSAIDVKNRLVGFQGDFTFDERVVTFQSEPVQKAGLTDGNWNVSGNVLPGTGPIRTLRISAFSNDFTPLSGPGTLFELRMRAVSDSALPARNASHSDAGGRIPHSAFPLVWAAPPDNFIFIDADLNTQKPGNAASGSVALRRR